MSDTSSHTFPLSPQARSALAAYVAMRESKNQYFALLQGMDKKYRRWGHPSDDEKRSLDELLELHNQRVSDFKQAMAKVEDPNERMALIQRLD